MEQSVLPEQPDGTDGAGERERHSQAYRAPFRERFRERVDAGLRDARDVLDVGGGAHPVVSLEGRPPGVRYVGLDLSAAELERAPAGSYDQTVTADIGTPQPELRDRFDLIVSFQVLEHVRPLPEAFAVMRSYLRPGGRMVVQFSGTFSAFGMANWIVPQRTVRWLLRRLTTRDPANTFPAHFHRSWDGALRRTFESWEDVEIVPIYVGGGYFRFNRLVQRAYLAYEGWARRGEHRNLATHYVVSARRPER